MRKDETTSTVVKIACIGNDLNTLGLEDAKKALTDLGCACVLEMDVKGEQLAQVLENQNQIIAIPLKKLSLEIPEGYCIAALYERKNPSYSLLIKPAAFEEGKVLRLKKNALVACYAEIYCSQIKDFRSDIEAFSSRDPKVDELLRKANAFLMETLAYEDSMPYEVEAVTLNPKELIPLPGQGVLAFLAPKSDKPLRRLLQKIHHKDVAKATNIERGILAKFPDAVHQIAAYCELDKEGNYHVYAVKADPATGKAHYVQHSSSTSAGLVESIVKKWA